LKESNEQYARQISELREDMRLHDARKAKVECLQEKLSALGKSRDDLQKTNSLIKTEKLELEDRLVDMSIKMRSKMEALDLSSTNWDMAERRAAEDATLCASHFKSELEKVHQQLAAAQAEITSLRPNLELLVQEKQRLQRELTEARMLKDQHLTYAQELQTDLELRTNFEADLIQAQKVLVQKDAELEDEKQLRETQLVALKDEYERVVDDLKSSQKLADLLDALHNQGTFDALNNLSTLADAVVKHQHTRSSSASVTRGATVVRGLNQVAELLEGIKPPVRTASPTRL